MCYFFAYFSHGLPIFKLGKLSILSVSLFLALTNWLYNGFTFLSFDSGPNFRVFTGAADVEGAAYVLIDIKGAGVAAAGTTGAGGGHPLCLAAAAGKGTLLGGGQPLCLAAAAETEKNSWNNHTKWGKIRYIKKKFVKLLPGKGMLLDGGGGGGGGRFNFLFISSALQKIV